ncbi:prepilin-type N-terminal cleavage/methylation domain-containing protein [Campylobacter sp.]|uniref:type II secretion system protein n=1 Tax=Campylobacter sp. TaxID=205 RepID=UPI002AA716F5|nr:prepilin-type N-terminal cleavage/methylation domain-containing protein [Campylobacter sp.]MCI6563934.1 type II secretion system GspH family protein [Campylobacter sp.]
MKKVFTMIELIFVIVILGILASVAIPRLAATREDAEISAAVANLRTLVNDATAYYTVNGSFNTTGATTTAKWSAITSVPLASATSTDATSEASLKIGGDSDCIKVKLVEKTTGTTTTPAHIEIIKKSNANGTCGEVLKSDPLKPYFTSNVTGKSDNSNSKGFIAIGSSTSVYGSKK